MSEYPDISPEAIDRLYKKLFDEAESAGYHLGPDIDFTKDLVKGLSGNQATDNDIETGKFQIITNVDGNKWWLMLDMEPADVLLKEV